MSKTCCFCGTVNEDSVDFCIKCHSSVYKDKIDICKDLYGLTTYGRNLISLSEEGNIAKQFSLAKAYLLGLYGIKQNIAKSKELFTILNNNGYIESKKFLEYIENDKYDIEDILLSKNKKSFPAVICKNCETIIPFSSISFNSHRRIQVYGTDILSTISKQSLYDMFFSNQVYACPICCSENLISLETPLAESLIKKHSHNKKYLQVLLSDPEYILSNITVRQNEGCYIATCIYGDYDCSQVLVLRHYRDNYLMRNLCGKIFVNIYYFISPIIVKYFGEIRIFKNILKPILDKIVKIIKNKKLC